LVLKPEQEMYFKMKNPFFISVPPVHPKCSSDEKRDFEIIYPKNNLRIMLSGNTGSSGVLVLKAVSRNKNNILKWYLNNVYQGETRGIHHLEIKPEKGVYKLKVIDINGNEDEVFFEVI
jgi:membrane carboxypeptidase/penicillin-binding protein PbpC